MTSPQARQLLDLLDGFEMTKSQRLAGTAGFENMTVKESPPCSVGRFQISARRWPAM